jgi:hypothetical protein
VSLYSNDQEVLQAYNGSVKYIRMVAPNGAKFNVSVSNTGTFVATPAV